MHISGSETDTWKTKDRVKQSPLIIKNVYVVFHDMYDCPLCGEQKSSVLTCLSFIVSFIEVERSIQVAFTGIVHSKQVSYMCLFVTKTIYTLLFNLSIFMIYNRICN